MIACCGGMVVCVVMAVAQTHSFHSSSSHSSQSVSRPQRSVQQLSSSGTQTPHTRASSSSAQGAPSPHHPYAPRRVPFALVNKRYFTTDNGLPNNAVRGITQTPDQYLWIATFNGIARFDGRSFTIFNSQNTPHIDMDQMVLYAAKADGSLIAQSNHRVLLIHHGQIQSFPLPRVSQHPTQYTIYRDNNQQYWVADRSKLYIYDAAMQLKDSLSLFPSSIAAEDLITSFYEPPPSPQFPKNILLVGTEKKGLYAIQTHTKQVRRVPLPVPDSLCSFSVWNICARKNGSFFISLHKPDKMAATQQQFPFGVYEMRLPLDMFTRPVSNGVQWHCIERTNAMISCVMESADSTLWVGAGIEGVRRLVLNANGSYSSLAFTQSEGLPNAPVRGMMQTADGSVWIITIGAGIVQLWSDKVTHFTARDGLSSNTVLGVYEDAVGSWWVASSDNGGVDRIVWQKERASDGAVYENAAKVHRYIRPQPASPALSNNAALKAKEENGYMTIFQPLSPKLTSPKLKPKPTKRDEAREMWICPQVNGRLRVFVPEPVAASPASQTIPTTILSTFDGGASPAFMEDADGDVWSAGCAAVFHKGAWRGYTLTNKTGEGNFGVRTIARSFDGSVWVGSSRTGLYRCRKGGLKADGTMDVAVEPVVVPQRQPETFFEVTGLYEAPDHALWIAAYSDGLWRWHNGKMTQFSAKQGLPNNTIQSVIADDYGTLWMTSNDGIFSAPLQHLNEYCDGKRQTVAFTRYGLSNGMETLECNQYGDPSVWKTRDGRLLFCTMRGVAVIDPHPERVPRDTTPPTVTIENILLNNRTLSRTDSLVMESDQHYLAIHYKAPCFVGTDNVRYKYRMEGFDTEWHETNGREATSFNALPPGEYTFHIIACNADGVWNMDGARVMIRVPAPFWQTWWFGGLCVAVAVAASYGGYWWRLRVLHERTAALEQLVAKRTEQLEASKALVEERNEQLLQQGEQIQQANEELRNLNMELVEKNIELLSLNEEKNEFLGIAAHDLKNPLTGIMGIGEMMEYMSEDGFTSEQIQHLGHSIAVSAERMFGLIRNLLDVNAIERGGWQLLMEHVDSIPLVEKCLDRYAHRAADKDITLHKIYEAASMLVVADALALEQILENLISNAVKYSPLGKNVFVRVRRPIRRTIASPQASTFVQIEVADEGPGISAEDQQKLFGKFARLSAQPTGGEHSTGLGLSIVKKLVEAMEGRVWCESNLDEGVPGATFVVELPEVIVELPEVRV